MITIETTKRNYKVSPDEYVKVKTLSIVSKKQLKETTSKHFLLKLIIVPISFIQLFETTKRNYKYKGEYTLQDLALIGRGNN